jgi:hypothetical protein
MSFRNVFEKADTSDDVLDLFTKKFSGFIIFGMPFEMNYHNRSHMKQFQVLLEYLDQMEALESKVPQGSKVLWEPLDYKVIQAYQEVCLE